MKTDSFSINMDTFSAENDIWEGMVETGGEGGGYASLCLVKLPVSTLERKANVSADNLEKATEWPPVKTKVTRLLAYLMNEWLPICTGAEELIAMSTDAVMSIPKDVYKIDDPF